MLIIGCDYHPGFQQIAFVNQATGECGERRLQHPEEAQQFYRELHARGETVCVGMEASGHGCWFERLLGELHFELRVGDAAEIRAKRVRKQKTDRQDAQLLLRLLLEDRFPTIWIADWENRDLRQLLWHRHRLVQMRTRVMNQLHVVAMNEGMQRKKALWGKAGRRQLESLALAPWANRRRQDLLEVLDQLNPKIQELTRALEQEVEKREVARRLMTHPGVGALTALAYELAPWANRRRQDLLEVLDQLNPKIQELTRALEQEVEKREVARRLMTHPGVGALTALAYELIIGTPERFNCGKQIASYVGLVPAEESSGERRRLGHISKQGNSLLRFLLGEAAQATVRKDPDWKRRFIHLAMRRERRIAKVAMARKLAVSLYWMWRKGLNYEQMKKLGSHAG